MKNISYKRIGAQPSTATPAQAPTQSLMFLAVAVAPLVAGMFSHDEIELLVHAGALIYFAVAFWWISIGIRNRRAYDNDPGAKRPRIPFLIGGAVLLGLTLAVLIWFKSDNWASALLQGALGSALCLLSFGIDPLHSKEPVTAEHIRIQAARDLASQATNRLYDLKTSIDTLDLPDVSAQVGAFSETCARMIQALLDIPDRHREIRKYLGHYLDETTEVTRRFVTQYRATGDVATREEYETFISFMEAEFSRELQTFVTDDRDSMSVQISALHSKLGHHH